MTHLELSDTSTRLNGFGGFVNGFGGFVFRAFLLMHIDLVASFGSFIFLENARAGRAGDTAA